ncbi:peptidylprolyl isomerase [Mangrovibacterium lignilyticum]|uniref:peptidylprolyl isomerase n=1 Tax=Mangrovibacterium lignilyticum TaxID=2668052 RepID=UPI0013D40DA5|nr:peptidylprolyl isomerase [Mangrovibacterium lignilyticum]
MKRIKFLIGVCVFLMHLPYLVFSQSEDQVLLTISGEPISKTEFVRLYRKNNQNLQDDSLRKTPDEYLELFINYRLKVRQAKELGMDTLASFQEEYKQYRDQVAMPYLSYSNITDESLHDAYQRMTTEVKASHLLLKLAPDAPQEIADSVYNQCLKLRQQLLDGADFGEMARSYSDDPSVVKNNGLLGYFAGFQMVPEFDEAAFQLKPGEVSMPIRTKFGYHLILVHDKRPSAGQLQVAHIMRRVSPDADDKWVESAKQEMDSLKNLLDQGADFTALARQYSDDQQTAMNGGILPWFASSGMVAEFADAAFALKKDGDISNVIRTAFGFHIIKQIAHKPVQDFEAMKPMIIEKLRSNPVITQHNQELFVTHLKEIYHFQENTEALNKLVENYTSKYLQEAATDFQSLQPNSLLFEFDSTKVTQQDFVDYLKKQPLASSNIQQQLNHLYTQFVHDKLLENENNKLEDKYPEFRDLVQEYYDGILLFNLSEEKVWNKAQEDTVGLQRFYEKNKNNFLWEERFDGWAIQCNSQTVRDYIDEIFAEDAMIQKNELVDLLNLDFPNQAFIQKGIFARGNNNLVDYLVWDASKPQNFKDGLYFVRGDLIPPSPKLLNEARGQILSAYQDELEKEWISSLRKEYKVRVDKQVLKTIESIK